MKLKDLPKVPAYEFRYDNKATRLGYAYVADFWTPLTIKVHSKLKDTTKIIGWQDIGVDEKLMHNKEDCFVIMYHNDEDGYIWEHGLNMKNIEEYDVELE